MIPLASSTPTIFAMSELFVTLFVIMGFTALVAVVLLPIIYMSVMMWRPLVRILRRLARGNLWTP